MPSVKKIRGLNLPGTPGPPRPLPCNVLVIQYSAGGKIEKNEIGHMPHVALMGEGRCVQRVLVGKPEGRRPLGRPRRRWEDNIKMDLQEVGGGCGDWVDLAEGRERWRALVSTVVNLRVP